MILMKRISYTIIFIQMFSTLAKFTNYFKSLISSTQVESSREQQTSSIEQERAPQSKVQVMLAQQPQHEAQIISQISKNHIQQININQPVQQQPQPQSQSMPSSYIIRVGGDQIDLADYQKQDNQIMMHQEQDTNLSSKQGFFPYNQKMRYEYELQKQKHSKQVQQFKILSQLQKEQSKFTSNYYQQQIQKYQKQQFKKKIHEQDEQSSSQIQLQQRKQAEAQAQVQEPQQKLKKDKMWYLYLMTHCKLKNGDFDADKQICEKLYGSINEAKDKAVKYFKDNKTFKKKYLKKLEKIMDSYQKKGQKIFQKRKDKTQIHLLKKLFEWNQPENKLYYNEILKDMKRKRQQKKIRQEKERISQIEKLQKEEVLLQKQELQLKNSLKKTKKLNKKQKKEQKRI